MVLSTIEYTVLMILSYMVRLKFQNSRIHAKALICRWWTILENVSEMRSATAAHHFCSFHTVGIVSLINNAVGAQ